MKRTSEIDQYILAQIFPKGKFKVEYECDDCHKLITTRIDSVTKTFQEKNAYLCNKCSQHRTVKNKYNVDCTFEMQEVKNKIKATNLKKYGYECSSKSPVVRQKISNSLNALYTNDANRTNDYERREKKKIATIQEKYGQQYTSVSQVPQIREKIITTMLKYDKVATSQQQIYIHSLIGGELNYQIQYYPVDIVLINDKIIIEYDGGGHKLSIKFGQLTEQQFTQKEIIRDKCIIKNGWKIIRLIAIHDKLPNDDIIIDLIEQSKLYLLHTTHHWINIDLENNYVKSTLFETNFTEFLKLSF